MPSIYKIELGAALGGSFPPYHTYLTGPGDYTIRPVMGASVEGSAWNAWSGQVEIKPDGTLAKGWLNKFHVFSPAFPANQRHLETSSDNTRYATPQEALAAAQPVRFTLEKAAILVVHIQDSYHDNVGGLMLEVTANHR